ncbi:uncharacterized protein METZ01_LOCUS71673, partial [marine metagenome]
VRVIVTACEGSAAGTLPIMINLAVIRTVSTNMSLSD